MQRVREAEEGVSWAPAHVQDEQQKEVRLNHRHSSSY